MARRSAGIVLFRRGAGGLQVLLVHPGGPFWSRRREGAWSIPKGEYADGETPLACALREFEEELGSAPPAVEAPIELGAIRQAGGKAVVAWAIEGDFDPATLRSGTFAMEWPPRSGRTREFPEVDAADWFGLDEAREVIVAAQAALLDRLGEHLGGG